jgi:hypothetical protein
LKIQRKLNLPNDGKGIDGVFRTRTGTLVPYQVKFRSHRANITFTDAAKFLALTDRATDRIFITNAKDIADDAKIRDGMRTIRGMDFDDLGYVRPGCAFRSGVESTEFPRGPLDPNCCRGTEYATLLRSPSRDGVAADLGLRIGGRCSSAREAPSLHPGPLVAKDPEREKEKALRATALIN